MEKSLYLCNRFREGEPLKMTDVSKAEAMEESAGCCTSILPCGCARGARKGKPHAF